MLWYPNVKHSIHKIPSIGASHELHYYSLLPCTLFFKIYFNISFLSAYDHSHVWLDTFCPFGHSV